MDFERDELSAVLAAHGYAMTRPTLFILEAVSQYLTEGGINETFAFLAKAAPGSRLAFTYVRKGFLRGELGEAGALAHERFVQTKTWLFGLEPDEVDGFLGAHGWRVLEHVGYDELARRYVEPTGRSLIPSTTERVVYAERR